MERSSEGRGEGVGWGGGGYGGRDGEGGGGGLYDHFIFSCMYLYAIIDVKSVAHLRASV